MNLLRAIYQRRSVRHYTADEITDSQVDELIRAAMYAPSSGNAQPWHFIVIRDRAILDEITTFHPYAHMLITATVAVLVCADLTLEKFVGRWMLDCSAAAQNLLLAAHGSGLGAVWVSLYPEVDRMAKVAELVQLPEHVQPVCLIPVGVPAEPKRAVDRFKPERIHHDRW